MSSSTDGQLILKAMRAGAKEFLTHPIKVEDLLHALDRISAAKFGGGPGGGRSCHVIAICGATGGVEADRVAGLGRWPQRDRGAAVVFVSTELAEVLAVSDRVVVMHKGEIMGEVPPEPGALGRIGEMMMGRSLASIDAGAVA